MFTTLWRLLQTFQEFLLLLWLRIYRKLFKKTKYNSVDSFNHKILCIGDGTFEGVGDVDNIFKETGIAKRLNVLLSQGKYVRQNWTVINRGHNTATSDDWLPRTKRKPKDESGVLINLWRDTFENNSFKDAEVIFLSIGAMDNQWGKDKTSASHTVDNISKICDILLDMEKIIVVSNIVGHGLTLGHKRRNEERNKLLKICLLEKMEKYKGKIVLGPDFTNPKFILRQDIYSLDNVHFNSLGYDISSVEWIRCAVHALLRVEWHSWKSKFANNNEKHTKKIIK